MAAVYLTRKGYRALHAELRQLVEVRRPEVMSDLMQSREYGDIRENAEYETAKRDQGIIEGRIHELEGLLASVEIIEVPQQVTEAVLGARVRVENTESKNHREYQLVSEQEAHIGEGNLSVDSPLGRALLGRRAGDVVAFEAPAGTRQFRVIALFGANGDDE